MMDKALHSLQAWCLDSNWLDGAEQEGFINMTLDTPARSQR
jgi:hypothetical protein